MKAQTLRFTWMEFSGSLGDLGLFIPLVVAMTISSNLNIGSILIWAGLMNIVTGWLFRQPIPVQPMKAIAAVMITEGMTQNEMIAAGLIIGVILLLISGFIDKINQYIPKAVVRGIQLGVGLKLVLMGIKWVSQLSMLGWNSVLFSILIGCILFVSLKYKKPALVFIFLIGFVLLYIIEPSAYAPIQFQWLHIYWQWPIHSSWMNGLFNGVIPQLPLTLLNSVVALCALSAKYFPQDKLTARKVALSVGLMNLLCVPLGGVPMCHGAGGLAAQYRFGARTGGSVIILGIIKVIAGIFLGSALLGLLSHYPMSILGPMIIFAGIELAKSSKDVMSESKGMIIAIGTAGVILIVNTGVGFLAGMIMTILLGIKLGGYRE